MSHTQHAAILLAAGASRRLGQPKALIEIEGEPLLQRTARRLVATQPLALWVVTGEPGLAARLMATLDGLDVRQVHNKDWRHGMAASLRAGLVAAAQDPIAGALVCPCDLPQLSTARLAQLLGAWRQAPDRAAACRYRGVVGAPAVLPRRSFADAAAVGDRGARDWLRAQTGLSVIDAPELAFDLDLPQDLLGPTPAD